MPALRVERVPTADEFAHEVHAFLVSLDLTRFTHEAMDSACSTLAELHSQAHLVRWSPEVRPAARRLMEALVEARHLAEEADVAQLRDTVAQRYAALARALEDAGLTHVRHHRPVNWSRSIFHAGMGVGAALLSLHLLSVPQARWLALGFAGGAWTLETLRRVYPGLNRFLMQVFAKVAHEHEAERVNSATWFCTGVLALALLFPGPTGILGLLTIAVGDPVAGIIGRRWGKHRLASGRSWEGSLSFVAASLALALPYLWLYEPGLGGLRVVTMAGAAALAGAAVELFVDRIDDNLAVPVVSALAAWVVLVL